MMRKLLLALAFCFAFAPASAQNTQCSNRTAGDSTNACANTRFVQGATSAIAVTIESAGGGTGKTSAENTAAINTILATGTGNVGVRIVFGPGTYNYLPPINITKQAVGFAGAGLAVTNLQCNPVADVICLNFDVGIVSGEMNNPSITNMSLTGPDTTFKKTMIKAVSQTGMFIENVLCGDTGLGGGILNGGGTGGSICLYTLGHQLLRTKNFYAYAEQPLIFGKNPLNYISADHYHQTDLYLIGSTGKPLIQYEPGVTIFDAVYDGTQAWVRGTDGLFIDPALAYNNVVVVGGGGSYVVGEVLTIAGGTCTTQPKITVTNVSAGVITSAGLSTVGVCSVLVANPASQTSTTGSGSGATFTLSTAAGSQIHASNVRTEQGTAAGSYSFNLQFSSVGPYTSVTLDNPTLDGTRKGIIARNVSGLTLSNAYGGGTDVLNVDSSVESVFITNSKFTTGTTTTITGQNNVFNTGIPTGYAFPALWSLSPSMQLTNFGNQTTYGSVPIVGINKNTATTIPASIPNNLSIISADDATASMVFQGFANSSAFTSPSFNALRSRGTAASPGATLSGDQLFSIAAYGLKTAGGTAYLTGAGAALFFNAAENYDASHGGSNIDLVATPLTSITAGIAARVHGSKAISIGDTTDPGAGSVSITGKLVAKGTVPVGTTGTCTASSFTGGATAGRFTDTAICGIAGTLILSSMPAAPTGYSCAIVDETTATAALRQTASTTTSTTFTVSAATVANDFFRYQCTAW